MNEKVSNKILAIALCPIYLCIALFAFFVVGLTNVNASFVYGAALDNLTNSEVSSWSSNEENTFGFTYINAKEQGQIRLFFMDNDWVNESAQSNDYVFVVDFGGRGTPINQLSISSYSASFGSIKTYSLEKINSRRCFSYGPVDCTSYRFIVHFYYNSIDAFASLYFRFNTFDNNDYWLGFYDGSKNVNINLYTEKEYQEIKRQEETNNKLGNIDSSIKNQTQVEHEDAQKQLQEQQETNKKLDEMNDYITDDTPPDSDVSVLGNVSGLLPPGPVDSLLNIPFNFLSILTSSFGGVCRPLEGTFVFNTTLSIPCFSSIFYDKVPKSLMVFLDIIPTAFMLVAYFKHLYKKIERATSLETNSDDEWGVI